jgi:hypothetical protein
MSLERVDESTLVEVAMNRNVGWMALVACALSSACAGTTGVDGAEDGMPTATGAPGSAQSTASSPATSNTPATGSSSMAEPQAAKPGSGAPMPAAPSAGNPMGPAEPNMPMMAPAMAPVVDECGLHTKFNGDQFCIKPPPADKGFQVHIGPSSYDNPEPMYVLEPGMEVTENFNAVTTNDTDQFYFYRQQRMRPGSHHLLISTAGELIVSSQNPVADTPAGGKIAPEDEDVGFSIAARSALFIGLHFINITDEPILKEIWINFWYKDASEVKEAASPIFTGAPIDVPPGAHVVTSGDCPISAPGRLLRLFGHKHANNVRWSTYRIRGEQRDLLFEDYDHWEEPLILEYSSITQNPKSDRANKIPGGWSGMVDLQPGDVFRFECEIVNNTDSTFTGKNEAVNDEMCIQNGTIVGTTIARGSCTTSSVPVTE